MLADKIIQPAHFTMDIMGQDETAQIGNFDGGMGAAGFLIGKPEQGEWYLGTGFPYRLYGRNFCWLMLEGIEAMKITN